MASGTTLVLTALSKWDPVQTSASCGLPHLSVGGGAPSLDTLGHVRSHRPPPPRPRMSGKQEPQDFRAVSEISAAQKSLPVWGLHSSRKDRQEILRVFWTFSFVRTDGP